MLGPANFRKQYTLGTVYFRNSLFLEQFIFGTVAFGAFLEQCILVTVFYGAFWEQCILGNICVRKGIF